MDRRSAHLRRHMKNTFFLLFGQDTVRQWPYMNKNALTRYQYGQHLTLRLFSAHGDIVKLRQPAYDFLPSQAKFIKIAIRVFLVYFSASILSILIFSDIACKVMFSDSRTLKMYVLWVLYSTPPTPAKVQVIINKVKWWLRTQLHGPL